MGQLDGKVAIVTGGSRGIGEGIARRLAAEGAAVAITYHGSTETAELVAKDINGVALRVDSGDRDAVRAGVRQVVEHFGRLDILVNNAGVAVVAPIGDLPDDAYDRSVAVNLTGVYTASQEALHHLGAGGRIITIGSVNADRVHFGGGSVYALTKAGIAGFTRALAREVGQRGITVNTVQPGPVDTDMNPADGPFAGFTRPHIAIDRYGSPAEVASLVAYLAGPESTYVTGATLNADGGYSA
jgi:3-oxoacyl-[acyl-carrier protein] reductase